MILTVANTKGGVGKTTLALNLVISRATGGGDAWLIDGDRQQTASTAISVRSEANRAPPIACAAYADGPMLRSQVLQQKSKFSDIVIDVGGRDSTALRAALMVTDALLVPFQPRSYDVWALGDIAQLVREANSVRDGLRVLAILNFADPAGTDNREAAKAVEQFPELAFLDAPIHRRKAYANAAGRGLAVWEVTQPDMKACAEVAELVRQIYGDSDTGIR